MKNKKTKLIIPSILTILGCVAISAGSTYSLFTSETSNNIVISSGKVDVEANAEIVKTYSLKNGESAETDVNGTFTTGGSATLDGGSLTLSNIAPGDKVEYKVTIKNNSSITCSYRTSLLYSDDNGLFGGLNISVSDGSTTKNTIYVGETESLAVGSEDKTYTISVELPKEASSEYMNKSCTLNFKVEAVQGNGTLVNDTLVKTLEEYNALTTLEESVKTVYVTGVNITASDFDGTAYKNYLVGNTNLRNASLSAIDLYISGSFTNNNDYSDVDSNKPYLVVCAPDESNVTLSSFTFNGMFAFSAGDSGAGNVMNNVYFKGATINGLMVQNGNPNSKNLVFDGVTFNDYVDSITTKNSFPAWIKNGGTTNYTLKNSTVYGSRPFKVVEGNMSGDVVIENNTFYMDDSNNKEANKNKSQGIFIDGNGETGTSDDCVVSSNVTIKNNILGYDASSLIAFNDDHKNFNWADGKTLTVSGNKAADKTTELSGAKLASVYKYPTQAMNLTSNKASRAS